MRDPKACGSGGVFSAAFADVAETGSIGTGEGSQGGWSGVGRCQPGRTVYPVGIVRVMFPPHLEMTMLGELRSSMGAG